MAGPRSLHQMAYFFVETPVSAGSGDQQRWLQRGFLVHGGETTGGALLKDLWLFDLTNADAVCGGVPCPGQSFPNPPQNP